MAIGFLLFVLGASVAAGALWQREHERASPLPPTPTKAQQDGTSPAPYVLPPGIQRAIDAYKLLPPTRASGDATPPSKHDAIDLDVANVQRWKLFVEGAASVLAPIMHANVAQLMSFALAWIAIESGGNPCAVGVKTKTIPPKNAPQEIGLFQIYNPHDFKELGVDPSTLVRYCVRPAAGDPNPQKLLRAMTSNEIAEHITTGLRMIAKKRAYAGRYLAESGVAWPTTSIDYWRMTKAVHALPVLVNTGIRQVTKKLGRAPISWREYRDTYETINPRAKYSAQRAKEGKSQDGYYRALENAEWTGEQVPDVGAVS